MLMTQHAAGRGVDLVFNAASLYNVLIAQITRDANRDSANLEQTSTAPLSGVLLISWNLTYLLSGFNIYSSKELKMKID
jgi:hypothetical protein